MDLFHLPKLDAKIYVSDANRATAQALTVWRRKSPQADLDPRVKRRRKRLSPDACRGRVSRRGRFGDHDDLVFHDGHQA